MSTGPVSRRKTRFVDRSDIEGANKENVPPILTQENSEVRVIQETAAK